VIRQEGQSKARKLLRLVSSIDQFLTHRLSMYDAVGIPSLSRAGTSPICQEAGADGWCRGGNTVSSTAEDRVPPPPASGHVGTSSSRNGMGTAALVVGVVALVLALLLIFFPIAFVLGILAVIFGIVGIRRVDRARPTTGTTRSRVSSAEPSPSCWPSLSASGWGRSSTTTPETSELLDLHHQRAHRKRATGVRRAARSPT
jgi:hypothetical protein